MMYTTYRSIYARSTTKQQQAKSRAFRSRRMRRAALLMTLFIGLCFTFTSIVQAWTGETDAAVEAGIQVESVIVQPGDTLWGIAAAYLPADNNYDIREYIQDIMKHNGMKASNLQAGDVIEVPLLVSN
ncbi:LysM peptidoglycan-binding domain-containing protein [Paenibacillus marinisediminis]